MRIDDKIREIEKYLDELKTIVPESLELYVRDFKSKAACERYFEMIIEAIVDLAFIIIKEKNLKLPEDDRSSFDVLADEEIISRELCGKFKDAKGMRNIVTHEYGKIDDELVFHSITEELIKDVGLFIKEIKR